MPRPGQLATRDLAGEGEGQGLGRSAGRRGPAWGHLGLLARTGTCTNTTADDCVLPSGEVTDDCEVAADQWVVNDPSKPHCPHISFTTRSPATSPPVGRGTTARKDCASPLCELIKDR